MLLKRNNWSNQEVVKLLEKMKTREDDEASSIHNGTIDMIIVLFKDNFSCGKESFNALTYNPIQDKLYHAQTTQATK